jgi:uridine kinase
MNLKNEIFLKIEQLLKSKMTVIVAIDGNSASGKTALAKNLSEKFDCNVFHMDNFFLQKHQRTSKRLEEIGGNIDYERFFNEVLLGIMSEKEFSYQLYNCKTQQLEEEIKVKPKNLTIIEGVYSMREEFLSFYDLKIFLSVNPEEQRSRILKRNGEEMLKRFENEWIPFENRYFSELNIKEKCDFVY